MLKVKAMTHSQGVLNINKLYTVFEFSRLIFALIGSETDPHSLEFALYPILLPILYKYLHSPNFKFALESEREKGENKNGGENFPVYSTCRSLPQQALATRQACRLSRSPQVSCSASGVVWPSRSWPSRAPPTHRSAWQHLKVQEAQVGLTSACSLKSKFTNVQRKACDTSIFLICWWLFMVIWLV